MEAITIHYVLQGQGTLRATGGVECAYAPFNVIVVPARVSQSLGAGPGIEADAAENCAMVSDGLVKFTAGDGTRDTLVVCATITASYGGAIGLFDHLRTPVVEDFSENATLRHIFEAMLAEASEPGIGTQALTEALMKQCLILMLRHHLDHLSIDSPFFAVLQDHRLARAVTDVITRPAAAHSVESLARVAGMSRSTFAARFSDTFQQTPMDFVQRVRLRLGARLLRTTDLPIKMISANVGYASRSYFTRAFRNAHGIDPRSFRARAAEGERFAQLVEYPSLVERIVGNVDRLLDDDS